jgi:uncharacterized protein YecT (DUF1311 family)
MNCINKNKVLLTSLGFMLTCSFGAVLPMSAQNQPNCESPSRTSQATYGTCVAVEYERADKKLNSVWKQVISQLSGDAKERLIDRQLAWIDERDAICDRETQDSKRGMGYRIFLNLCLRRVTIERTEVLRGYLR